MVSPSGDGAVPVPSVQRHLQFSSVSQLLSTNVLAQTLIGLIYIYMEENIYTVETKDKRHINRDLHHNHDAVV